MFNLEDFEKEIRTAATSAKITPEDALNKFVYNLTIMRDHHQIFNKQIDFRALGQAWNRLSSDARIQQKTLCCNALKRASRGL